MLHEIQSHVGCGEYTSQRRLRFEQPPREADVVCLSVTTSTYLDEGEEAVTIHEEIEVNLDELLNIVALAKANLVTGRYESYRDE